MKSNAVAGSGAAFYADAADQERTAPRVIATPQPGGRRDPSPDRHGAMAAQLRQAARGDQTMEAAPSPRSSVAGSPQVEAGSWAPPTLDAFHDALRQVESRALAHIDAHHQAHAAELQSWPPVTTYQAAQATFEHWWSEALNQAGYQALTAQALPEQEQAEAAQAEDEMTERVSEQVMARFSAQGWHMNGQPEGLTWGSYSPLALIRHCDFPHLETTAATARHGEHGSVQFLSTPLNVPGDGAARYGLAFKRPHGEGWRGADHEVKGYKKVIEEVGLHPNLMVSIGLARVHNVSGLLLERVAGCDGEAFLGALHRAIGDGSLSAADGEAVLALLLERGLSVIDHCRGASVCISDMKPGNFIVSAETGEPCFHDLGLWTPEGDVATGSTRRYAPPEAEEQTPVNHRSDMSGLVASLAEAVGGGQPMYRHSPQGRVEVMPNLVDTGNADCQATIRHPADAPATPFWRLAAQLMYRDEDGRRSFDNADRMGMEEARRQVGGLRSQPGHEDAHVLAIMKSLVQAAGTD